MAEDLKLTSVCDIGCGSGYKLMHYLNGFQVIGIDLPPTVEALRKKYPQGRWYSGFDFIPPEAIDLVIASDVVEHLPDPDELMKYIGKLAPKHIILSTPDRDLLRSGTYNGPPSNPAHVREWGFFEFREYVSSYFDVDEHFISSAAQATQCVLCHTR